MAVVSTADQNDLPDSDFAYIEPGGTKDASGKTVPRDKRHFPIQDAAHVRNALARAAMSPFGDKAMPKIKAAADKFGIQVGSGDDSSRTVSPRNRFFDRAEVQVDGDGQTVEAYAAIFNTPASVHDQDGDYEELLDPSCFNRAIDHINRSGRRVPVLFNHGRTIYGTPSPEDSVPIGVAEEIRADGKGLYTRARFHDTPRAADVLAAIKGGSITAYSFQGAFNRSDPIVPAGGFRKSRGKSQTVRRMECTLREFGPATFPVYEGAKVTNVRAEDAYGVFGQMLPDELERLAGMMRSGTLLEHDGTPDEGPATTEVDSPDGHSTRSPRDQIRASYARFISRRQ
jgi:HK97 family phage prohead protease